MPNCLSCGAGIDEYDSGYYSRNMLCIPCYVQKTSEVPMVGCEKCGRRIKRDEARERRGGTYCSYCFSELERVDRLPHCVLCEKQIDSWQQMVKSTEGRTYHAECTERAGNRIVAMCAYCNQPTDHFKLVHGGFVICSRCSAQQSSPQTPQAPDSIGAAGSPRPLMATLIHRIGAIFG